MIFLAYKSRLFDPVWKFRKFVTCSCCSCQPQVGKCRFVQAILGKFLNTCSCSTDLATNSLLGAAQVCCHHQVYHRSKIIANRENCFTFPQELQQDSTSHGSNYHFRLGKIRLPGTPIRIPEASQSQQTCSSFSSLLHRR